MTPYKLPKQYHQDFKLPKRKPTGNVELDLSDYYAKRLLFSVIPTSQRGNLDLVSGAMPANTNVTMSPNDGDIAAVYNDSNSKLVFSNSGVLIDVNKSWTICWRGSLDLFGSQEHDIASLQSTESNSFTLIHLGIPQYTDVNWGMASPNFPQGRADFDTSLIEEDTVYFLSYDPDKTGLSKYSFWVNRSEQTVLPGGNFGGIANTTAIGNTSTSNSNAYGGYQKYFHVFDFKFEQADVNRFFNNQWRILKPKSPALYFTGEAASGITVTPDAVTSLSVSLNPTIVFSGALELSPNAANTSSVSLNPVIQFSSSLNLLPATVDSLSVSLNPVIEFTSALVISPDTVNSSSISLDPLIKFISVINLTPETVNSLSVSLNPIITTGEQQIIGTVTAGFKDDEISVKYKISGITVNFKE